MCVFGIYVLKIVIKRWFWKVYMVFRSLVVLHVWLHSRLWFSLLKKTILKACLTPPRHLAICRALKFFLITISIPSWYLVDRSRFSSCVFAFSSTPPRQLHLSMLFFSTPSSTDGLTPLDTSICQELLRIYIYAHRNPVLISSSSLDRSAPVHLPNTLSFTSNLFLKHSLRLIRFFFTW